MRTYQDVLKQLEAAFGDGFPKGNHPLPGNVEVIRDLTEARIRSDLHWSEEIMDKYGQEFPGEVWIDALETQSGRARASIKKLADSALPYSIPDQIRRSVDSMLVKDLKAMGLIEFYDNHIGCMNLIVYEMVLEAPLDSLGMTIFQTLCAGAIPCGLYKNWPNSPLIAYWPHERQPVLTSA